MQAHRPALEVTGDFKRLVGIANSADMRPLFTDPLRTAFHHLADYSTGLPYLGSSDGALKLVQLAFPRMKFTNYQTSYPLKHPRPGCWTALLFSRGFRAFAISQGGLSFYSDCTAVANNFNPQDYSAYKALFEQRVGSLEISKTICQLELIVEILTNYLVCSQASSRLGGTLSQKILVTLASLLHVPVLLGDRDDSQDLRLSLCMIADSDTDLSETHYMELLTPLTPPSPLDPYGPQ